MVSYMIPHVASRVFLGEVHWTIEYHITLVVFARWPSGPPGPVGAAGAPAADVTKAISAKGRRPVAANTLLYAGTTHNPNMLLRNQFQKESL
jgi:hypothetical protein